MNSRHILICALIFISTFAFKANAADQVINTAISGSVDCCVPLIAPNSDNSTITITSSGSIVNNGSSGIPVGTYGTSYSNTTIDNSGSISGSEFGVVNDGTQTAIINRASGIINSYNYGMFSIGPTQTIQNNGQIFSNNFAMFLVDTVGNVINTGSINGSATAIYTDSDIGSITNTGTISSETGIGIYNFGTITTFNNLQGAGNSAGALTYYGTLPVNYNIIINSKTQYGQISVTGGSGAMNFGIYAGSKISNGTYTGVLSSLDNTITLNSSSGKFGAANWLLNPEGDCSVRCIWDLIISGYYSGPSTADTQQSLVNTASSLQNIYTLQNTVLANSFSYDCTEFGANNVCVSAGGRNTAVSAANGLNNTSGLLIAAYRPHPNYRIGAYADQNLSVNNAGSTVNLGNNTPLIGLFGAWSERLDGTGTEVKVSAAYGQKNATITRQVVGTSEPGTGSSTLKSDGAQLTAKYGFKVAENTIVAPYVGIRYTLNNMPGYTEATSSSVTAPLTYYALNTNATTALAGVGESYKVIPQLTTFASAGVESDTNTTNGTYTAFGVTGLTPINFNPNLVKTRPTATLGVYYDIVKNQRLGITGIYRQEPYQAVSTTTVMATYTVGL